MHNTFQNIQIDEFDYSLPDERIAKYPLEKRDESNLLIYNNGVINKDYFYNLDKSLNSPATLVFNNTRVIQARLFFKKKLVR